jgi:hypothetical protein
MAGCSSDLKCVSPSPSAGDADATEAARVTARATAARPWATPLLRVTIARSLRSFCMGGASRVVVTSP